MATPKRTGDNSTTEAFLNDLATVCRKHQMSLSHEDEHGAFQVEGYDTQLTEWLLSAHDMRKSTTANRKAAQERQQRLQEEERQRILEQRRLVQESYEKYYLNHTLTLLD
ncbi:hypothetical protein LCGC14_2463290 [marine sediment metagenome]|uniref:Uncharacterized protein n=1 Tax=marine sediment metagenome TaxID=412755 RepID=A0A0F9C0C6_9ZZZZ